MKIFVSSQIESVFLLFSILSGQTNPIWKKKFSKSERNETKLLNKLLQIHLLPLAAAICREKVGNSFQLSGNLWSSWDSLLPHWDALKFKTKRKSKSGGDLRSLKVSRQRGWETFAFISSSTWAFSHWHSDRLLISEWRFMTLIIEFACYRF